MSCFVGGQKPASETLIRFHHPQTVLSIAEAKSNERSPLMEGRQGRGGNPAEGEWGGLGDDFHGWEVAKVSPDNSNRWKTRLLPMGLRIVQNPGA